MKDDGLVYYYSPAAHYKMALTIRAGRAFDTTKPPHVAIWLENASFYHIKTLHEPDDLKVGRAALPYWDFKVRGWEKAKRKAKESGKDLSDQLEVDGVSGATQNSSFNPADYVLPSDPDNPMPYRLLIEIDQPDDDQPSLVYSVEIDNSLPRAFQLLDLVGYPEREEDDKAGKESWALYFVDEQFDSALALIDSALQEFVNEEVINRFEKELVDVGRRLTDAKFHIRPSLQFIDNMKLANKRLHDQRDEGVKNGPLQIA